MARRGHREGREPDPLVVVKRAGHADPLTSWCWLRLYDLLALADDAQTCFVFPVRMELHQVLDLLTAAGYTTNPEEN